MGPRAQELLRQILATPDDLALRAVYADELQAAGDPRGEFIALDLANDPAHAGRRIVLLAKHAAQWWPEIPRHRLDIRNGFVERVAGVPAELVGGARLFATEPIRDVEMIYRHDNAAVETLGSNRVRRFAMRGAPTAAMMRIATSSFGEHLEAFEASGCAMTPNDVKPLGAALPACRELRLADNHLIGYVLPRMLDWQHLASVEVLDLRSTTLTTEVLRELLARDLSRLRVLQLSANPLIGDIDRVIVEALPRLPVLERLELVDTLMPDRAITSLAKARPPRLAIAFGIHDLDARFPLDAFGADIALIRLGRDRWTIDIDGVRRSVRWRQLRSDADVDAEPRVLVDWTQQDGDAAPLDRLGVALATGARRTLAPTQRRIDIALRPSEHRIYGATMYASETVTIEYPASSSLVSITFEENVIRMDD
jgi:uncharacterized protein (TIGR02996 family)